MIKIAKESQKVQKRYPLPKTRSEKDVSQKPDGEVVIDRVLTEGLNLCHTTQLIAVGLMGRWNSDVVARRRFDFGLAFIRMVSRGTGESRTGRDGRNRLDRRHRWKFLKERKKGVAKIFTFFPTTSI